MQVFVRAKICPDPCKRGLRLRWPGLRPLLAVETKNERLLFCARDLSRFAQADAIFDAKLAAIEPRYCIIITCLCS